MDAIAAITGLKVNYYALIDLKGFQRLINAVGGVTINVKTKVPIGGETTQISGYIRPGKRHLTGYQALWYARSRTGFERLRADGPPALRHDGDAPAAQPAAGAAEVPGHRGASSQVISTSVPDSEIGTFVDLALKAKGQKITSIQFVPPAWCPSIPDFAAIRARVDRAIATAEKPPSQHRRAPPDRRPGRHRVPPRAAARRRPAPAVRSTPRQSAPRRDQPVPSGTGQQAPGPQVSIVMPILNEERHLAEAVGAAFEQGYAGPIEVVLALGPSQRRHR